MPRKNSERKFHRVFYLSLPVFVLVGMVCLVMGARSLIESSGFERTEKSVRAKLTKPPQIQLQRESAEDQMKSVPNYFQAADGVELVGKPRASFGDGNPSFSEPSATKESLSGWQEATGTNYEKRTGSKSGGSAVGSRILGKLPQRN